MGELHDMEKTITAGQLADKLKLSPDTMRKRFVRSGLGQSYSSDTPLSADQVRILSGQKAKTKRNNPQRQTPPAPDNPETKPARAFSWPDLAQVRHFAIAAVLVAVVICHGGLIWYDCAHLYGWGGVIGGCAVFLVVLAAVLLAADRDKYSTSEAALWFVFVVDVAAWWVHFPVFNTPDVSSTVTGFLCGFLCASSWVALYLFRNFKLEQ